MLLRKDELEEFIRKKGIKHFKINEFVCRHCGEVRIDERVVLLVERLRNDLGKPPVITSAYRCPVHYRRIGGVQSSAHVKGYALDVRCRDSKDRLNIVAILTELSVEKIGVHARFIHFDVDPGKPSPRLWLYSRKRHLA